jgi:uncharacterized protein
VLRACKLVFAARRRADADLNSHSCGRGPRSGPGWKGVHVTKMTERHDSTGCQRDSRIDTRWREPGSVAHGGRVLHRSDMRWRAALRRAARIRPIAWREAGEILPMTIRRAALGMMLLCAVLPAYAGPFERGLLWRVERQGSPPSYVFGTLHSTDARVLALPTAVAQAFSRSRVFAMEAYLSDAEEAEFFEAMQFDDGTMLAPLLGEVWFDRLKRALGPDAPAERILARTKPWAALLRVATPRMPTDATTLDRELLVMARTKHMSVIGLEALVEQVAAFDAIPLDTQLALLRHALDHRDALQAQVEPTVRAWLKRDLTALSHINRTIERGDPQLARHYALLTRHVVDGRSALMAYRLYLPLKRGGVFVAVGALHLVGAHGLLALLEQQGYRITRVY